MPQTHLKISFAILLLAAACSTKQNIRSDEMKEKALTNGRSLQDSLILEYTHEIKYELDTTSSASTMSVGVYPKEHPEFMIYHHTRTSEIGVYEITSGKNISMIKIQSEGPDGVGEGISAIHFHNFDSIFVFGVLQQKLYLIDSTGSILNKFNLRSDDSFAQLGTIFPAFIDNNSIFLSIYPTPFRKPSSADYASIKIDLNSNEITKVFNMSSQYDRGWWGKHHYLRINQVFNEESNTVVLSFPNDHFIYSTKNQNEMNFHYAGGKNIKDLEPLSDELEDDDEKTYQHEATQGFYSSIFYDRWKNVYYRFAFSPIVTEYQSAFDTEANMSVIILDKNFKKIGEKYLPKGTYSYLAVFVSPAGLHLMNQNKYDRDDNFLWFDVFNLQKPKD